MTARQATTSKMTFPALSALGLNSEQLAALAERGSLCQEDHGGEKRYCRLRFRVGQRQQTRYVGSKQGFVAQVRRELMRLQAGGRSRRELRRLADKARRIARQKKRSLTPLLERAGLAFHGRAIRRRRVDRKAGTV